MKKIFSILAVILIITAGVLTFKNAEKTEITKADITVVEEEPIDTPLPPLALAPQTVSFEDGTEATLQVADAFNITVASEDLGKARFMTKSPDGRLFVPDMVDYSLSREGRLLIFDDFNETSGTFESQTTYLSGLRGPHNVAFYTDESGQTWLYLTLTEHLVRYPYSPGDTEPSGEGEVIMEFPNEQSEGADGVVWHITRTLLFRGDRMYISVGSGCNVCEEAEDEVRAMIITANPEGGDVEVYAEGIKNAVGMEIVDGQLYATENGTDHLGDDAPNDLLYRIERNEHYGWPYCYEDDGEIIADESIDWERDPVNCGAVPISFVSFEAHSAPLGVTYFEDAHEALEDSFLVALQGSWEPEIGTGYQVVRISPEGDKEVFIDGFQEEDGTRIGRPVHVLQWNEDSLFITDDFNGRMYYLEAAS
ncbi:MAG: hypothetical protein WDZ70_02775 [Candidatus Paceibacterota bacterium]